MWQFGGLFSIDLSNIYRAQCVVCCVVREVCKMRFSRDRREIITTAQCIEDSEHGSQKNQKEVWVTAGFEEAFMGRWYLTAMQKGTRVFSQV